jgi:hypothetical protein
MSYSGRRLLSVQHEEARRMVLDFHGTRRTLQQVAKMLNVLRTIKAIRPDVVPTSNNPVLLRNGASNKVSARTHPARPHNNPPHDVVDTYRNAHIDRREYMYAPADSMHAYGHALFVPRLL